MTATASFALARAWRDANALGPLSHAEQIDLISTLEEWARTTRIVRADAARAASLVEFANAGEVGPRRSIEIIHED